MVGRLLSITRASSAISTEDQAFAERLVCAAWH